MDTSKVTRVEVIDHTKVGVFGDKVRGRVYVKWDDNVKIELAMQDDDRTLKVFIHDRV